MIIIFNKALISDLYSSGKLQSVHW